MSYILHPAAKTSTRAYFKDFSLAYLWNGPSKIAHVFTVVGATIPFYLFSSAYHGAKKSPTLVAASRYETQRTARLAGDDPYLVYRQRTLADRRAKS
jgi:hypothetical protein